MNTDYKLILLTDKVEGTQIRYRKQNEPHWATLFIKETDIDKVIDILLKEFQNGTDK